MTATETSAVKATTKTAAAAMAMAASMATGMAIATTAMAMAIMMSIFVKKRTGRGPLGVSKLTFFRGGYGGLGSRIFNGFQVVST